MDEETNVLDIMQISINKKEGYKRAILYLSLDTGEEVLSTTVALDLTSDIVEALANLNMELDAIIYPITPELTVVLEYIENTEYRFIISCTNRLPYQEDVHLVITDVAYEYL